jgi:hypothetical protein
MADEFASQFRRYWLVIITVIGACTTVFGFQLAMMNQIFELKTELGILQTQVRINLEALQRFADQGPRYTLQDHETYAREQRVINENQNRRLTILESTKR